MLGVQADLVFGAVQPEPDGAFSLAAVEVIDEEGLKFRQLSYREPRGHGWLWWFR